LTNQSQNFFVLIGEISFFNLNIGPEPIFCKELRTIKGTRNREQRISPYSWSDLVFIFRYYTNFIGCWTSKDKFKEALNIKPIYEYGNKNFNLSSISETYIRNCVFHNTWFLIGWNSIFSVSCSFYYAEPLIPVSHYALETEDCELRIRIQPIRMKRIKIKTIWLDEF